MNVFVVQATARKNNWEVVLVTYDDPTNEGSENFEELAFIVDQYGMQNVAVFEHSLGKKVRSVEFSQDQFIFYDDSDVVDDDESAPVEMFCEDDAFC